MLQAVRNLLYTVNSYYSNKIESEGTHIIDIEKAMQQDYSKDIKKRNLQILLLTHIEVQKECEEYFKNTSRASAYDKEFILNIHKSFYSKKGMEPFLHVTHDDMRDTIVPGDIRKREVKVGSHIAPECKKVDSFMNEFEHLYNKSLKSNDATKLIYILSSLDQISYMNKHLKLNALTSKIELYVQGANDGLLDVDPLPKHSEKIFKYLLLSGECSRGKVPEIIGMKDRTASRVISELLKRNFIESDSKAGPIRLKIGASMASYLFPMLVPEKD